MLFLTNAALAATTFGILKHLEILNMIPNNLAFPQWANVFSFRFANCLFCSEYLLSNSLPCWLDFYPLKASVGRFCNDWNGVDAIVWESVHFQTGQQWECPPRAQGSLPNPCWLVRLALERIQRTEVKGAGNQWPSLFLNTHTHTHTLTKPRTHNHTQNLLTSSCHGVHLIGVRSEPAEMMSPFHALGVVYGMYHYLAAQ